MRCPDVDAEAELLHSVVAQEHLEGALDVLIPPWIRRAACRGVADVVFFPTMKPAGGDYTAALAYCERCPVRTDCLTHGLEVEIGMFGGRTPAERKALRRAGERVASSQHRVLSRKITNVCEVCECEFGSTRVARFCSRRCTQRAHRARRNADAPRREPRGVA